MLTFQVEKFQDIAKELAPLFVHHWNESALDKEKIKLAPNWERYGAMQDEGILHIVTVRSSVAAATSNPGPSQPDQDRRKSGPAAQDDRASRDSDSGPSQPDQDRRKSGPVAQDNNKGKLVGYYFAMILPHLHYSTAGPMAYPDAYFILPQFRKGGAGAKLFAEMERTLWEKGVVKIYLSTKVHDDHGPLFERMGYKLTDKVYTKTR